LRIAYQGEPGAYSESAAERFQPGAETIPCASFEAVFDSVQRGPATHGVLPIENSIAGSIHRNYELLVEHELPIVGEVELRVEHHLLALPGTERADLKRVYSHPQALSQCERFLQHLQGVEVIATYDTAGSAKLIKEGGWQDAAAIASKRAADLFGLDVLEAGIQDYDTNITRFLVIARTAEGRDSANKTTIVFALPNEPGSLFKALSVFALRDIDLTKLESRPIRGRPWEYMFYVDLAVSRQDLRCGRALVHLAEFARWVRTLGSYEAWQEPAAPMAGQPTTDSERAV
jgi:prephenate dehydratase